MHDFFIRERHAVAAAPESFGHLLVIADIQIEARDDLRHHKFDYFHDREVGLFYGELLSNVICVVPYGSSA